MGRFMSPDWSAQASPAPYAMMGNPQSLNLYGYMLNNPLGGVDPDGHNPFTDWVSQAWQNVKHFAAGEGVLLRDMFVPTAKNDRAVDAFFGTPTVTTSETYGLSAGTITALSLAAMQQGNQIAIDQAVDSIMAPEGSSVLSGHGEFDPANGMMMVPEGTTITLPTGMGNSISDAYGNAIETGSSLTPFASEMTGAQSYLPGSSVPNLTLYPPEGLNIQGNPTTVTQPTNLNQLVGPNQGNVNWAACCNVKPPNQ